MQAVFEGLGWVVEKVDKVVLRHRFQRVCMLGWWLYNGRLKEGEGV